MGPRIRTVWERVEETGSLLENNVQVKYSGTLYSDCVRGVKRECPGVGCPSSRLLPCSPSDLAGMLGRMKQLTFFFF